MPRVRPPAVAGHFYPGEPSVLATTVRDLLDAAPPPDPHEAAPKALVVPHAGYVYSGRYAALGYARLCPHAGRVRRVVLLGPAHRVAVRGLALPTAEVFRTPLGDVPVAGDVDRAGLPQLVLDDAAHAQEHSLEVQLPFLQTVLDDVTLVPLVVGRASPEEVAAVLERLWGGSETLIVISTDLSHYLPYDVACQRDSATVRQVVDLSGGLTHDQACGATPLNGFLVAARRAGLAPTLLGAGNSGDTAGPRERVVGYACIAWSLSGAARVDVPDDAGRVLLPLARAALEEALGGRALHVPLPAWTGSPGACFVTLTENGRLRGCIGSVEPFRALADDVRTNAIAAAQRDRRFPPVTGSELAAVRIEISVLSRLEPLSPNGFDELVGQLRPSVDGVVLSAGGRRATFLPQVWEKLPEPAVFVAALLRKAGLPSDYWGPEVTAHRFSVRSWEEPERVESVAPERVS